MATSDGTTAIYYELPPGNPRELQDLIAYKNMNAQMGEIFRACYRYGEADHSEMIRDINKIIFYANAEKERLRKYVLGKGDREEKEENNHCGIGIDKVSAIINDVPDYVRRAKAEQERKAALAAQDQTQEIDNGGREG